MSTSSAGDRFRRAAAEETPLQIAGTPNALVALMAERIGFRALYLSGAGVANISFGLPDLGVTTLDNVLEDARRITGAVALPLLVDADTGFGAELVIARTVREMIRTELRRFTSRTRSATSAAVIARARRWSRRGRWWTGSAPR